MSKAHPLVLEIYKITRLFPEEEKFFLINQIRRSAISISANINEIGKLISGLKTSIVS